MFSLSAKVYNDLLKNVAECLSMMIFPKPQVLKSAVTIYTKTLETESFLYKFQTPVLSKTFVFSFQEYSA